MQSVHHAVHHVLVALVAASALHCDSPDDDSGPHHCVTVIAKLEPGQNEPEILERECYDSEDEIAKTPKFGSGTPIMTFYSDADYQGDSERIYGDAGVCDDAGYTIPNVGVYDHIEWPFGGWNDRISSFKTWSHCNHATAYEHENFGGREESWHDPDAIGMGVPYVGDKMNDMITSFWIRRGPK